MTQYTSLHNHSCFSIFDGYSKIPDIVSRAKELGHTAIALTEHGTLTSALPFYKECNEQGIKAIIGNEFYMTPDVLIKERKLHHLIVLAKDNIGYKNLLSLDTEAYRNVYYKPRIDLDMLNRHKESLIVLSACMGSIINTDQGEYWAQRFKDMLGDSFYLEIQASELQDQVEYNHKVVVLSKKLNIPLVITSDSHYPRQSDAPYHKHWINVNKGENEYYPVDDYFIMSTKDIYDRTRYLDRETVDTAIRNTGVIADLCNVTIKVEGNHYPVFPVDDKLEAVKAICRIGWREKILKYIPKDEHKKYYDRLMEELDTLEKCDYLNYLLITHDILDWCKRNNILTGIGRGSCGGSLVCYLMDITKINPIKYGLLFSRFVNIERITSADIDNDIESCYRDKVIEYIKEKYGEVHNIRTFNYLGAKGALQRASQSLRLNPQTAIQLSKNIDPTIEDIEEAYKDIPVEGNEQLLDVAKHFYGLLHAWGCHASAVLVFPDNPTNYCPIEKQGETFVASYDYHDLEDMSLVKLDVLGLRNLQVIHETLDLLDEPLDIYNLPMDDEKTYELYANGYTVGIFQVESDLMRSYAKQMKVDKFDDIAALISLVRPGPLDSGMAQSYINGKNGEEVICLHPSLESILGNTFQVLVYQEQLTEICQKMAGMTYGEADRLRKIVGRKELDKIEAAVNEFIERCVNNGISQDIADEVGRQMKACGRYIFNKSHGFLYAYTSYITGYLKANKTLPYMVSLLNSEIGDIEKTTKYIRECQRMDIEVIPPDIRRSKAKHCIDGSSIVFGFNALKGVGDITINYPFETFDQFLWMNPQLNKRVLESLIKAGAFDSINRNRGELLGSLESLRDIQSRIENCNQKIQENKHQLSLAADDKSIKKYTRQLKDWQAKLSLAQSKQLEVTGGDYDETIGEVEVLGFSFNEIPKIKTGVITKIFKKPDKNSNEMAWVSFNSPFGEFRCTVFSNGWSKIKDLVKQGGTHKFVVSDTGILEEISIGDTVIKTNERKKWSK